jgi:Lrp/AsnC family transcriptional regulator, regulator of ectoine-degradation genes
VATKRYLASMAKLQTPTSLDSYDLQILATLCSQGRMAKVKLAETIGLSPTPCGARIERLEKAGFIRGYHAEVDLLKLARLTRFRVTIAIRRWSAPKTKQLETAILNIPNIVECEAVLGTVDYMLTVVADSVSHYQDIMSRLISASPDEIDYTTYPASKLLKSERHVSLLKLSNSIENDL